MIRLRLICLAASLAMAAPVAAGAADASCETPTCSARPNAEPMPDARSDTAGTGCPGRLGAPASSSITLSLATAAPRAGEPLVVRLGGERSCLAESGHWLAVADTRSHGGTPTPPVTLDLAVAIAAETGVLMLETPPRPGRYRVRLHAPADRGGAVIAESAPFDVTPLAPGCRGFEGVWETDFGVLRLAERDGAVSGTFRKSARGQAGVVIGRREGDVMRGHWRSEFGAGGFRLVLMPDERRFTGTWSRFLEHTAGDGTWTGTCLDPDEPVR